MVGEDVPHRQLVRRVGRSSRCAQVSCEARCSPTSGRCAMPVGRRRCSGGGGTPFPPHAPPATATWLYVAQCVLAATEPAGVPSVDASLSATLP